MQYPRVSFIIVAYNAQQVLPELLSDLAAQDYPHERIQAVLVNSASTDGTRAVMEQFAAQQQDMQVTILDNPATWLASGINIALRACEGDCVVRLDAHARIPQDFVRANVEEMIAHGESIVGGCVSGLKPETDWQMVMTALDTSRFGGGAAPFRNPGEARYVDTLAYAMYRREIFERVGEYDERLRRTEDNEMHYRMRRAGYRFYFSPRVHSMHMARPTLVGQLRQKWGNGLWVGRTMGISPHCFALRHFIPAVFVLALLCCILLAVMNGICWPLAALCALYTLADLAFTVKASLEAPRAKLLCLVCLPWAFWVLHVCYGTGILCGLLCAPGMRKKK